MTNFDNQADQLERRAQSLAVEISNLEERLAVARIKTSRILQLAKMHGVTAVGIGKKHERLGNEGHPFGAGSSIFTPLNERIDDQPAAWRLAELMGISGGCGNPGQHQADISELIDGVYEIRGGIWHRIDGEVSNR